jgi:MFS family permease
MKEKGGTKEYKAGGWKAHYILIICSLLYMVNYMDRQVLASVLQMMKVDLGLSETQLGVLNTAFLLSIAFFSVPVSFMIDRWSRRKAVGIMAIFWSLFTYLTGLGRSFATVLIPRALVGVGESGFSAGGTALITAAYDPAKRGRTMAVFNLVIPLGAALGMILGGKIATATGDWSRPFFIFAIPGIILGILALFMKDYKTVHELDISGKRTGFFKSAASLFRIPSLKWMYIGYGVRNIMNFSVLMWLSAYLMRSHDIDAAKAGGLVGAIMMMAIIGALLGGFLSDSWQKKNRRARMLLPVIGDSLASIVLIIALFLEFKGAGFYVGMIWGALVMFGTPALNAVSQDVVTPGLKGTAWGMAVFCMYVFGGGWAPMLVGVISDAFITSFGFTDAVSLQSALYIMACSGFIAAIIFFIGSRSYPADMDRVKGKKLESER